MKPQEIINEKEGVSRLKSCSDNLLKALSPEQRECILDNDEFDGDNFKSDVYSFGLILL